MSYALARADGLNFFFGEQSQEDAAPTFEQPSRAGRNA